MLPFCFQKKSSVKTVLLTLQLCLECGFIEPLTSPKDTPSLIFIIFGRNGSPVALFIVMFVLEMY